MKYSKFPQSGVRLIRSFNLFSQVEKDKDDCLGDNHHHHESLHAVAPRTALGGNGVLKCFRVRILCLTVYPAEN